MRLVRLSASQTWAVLSCMVLAMLLDMCSVSWSSTGFLGDAGYYAILGLEGTYLNLDKVTVNGDVGTCMNGDGVVSGNSLVTGSYLYETYAPGVVGTVEGDVSQVNLSQACTDAWNAYYAAASYTPTQTYSTIGTNTTISGGAGLNVIKIDGDIKLSDAQNLTLNGSAGSFFILDVTGTIDLSGTSQITSSQGASSLLINVLGTGTKLKTDARNVIDGTILAPYRSVDFDCYTGSIIAGGERIDLKSGGTVNHAPLSSVPEPSSALAVLCMLGPSLAFIRRRRTASC